MRSCLDEDDENRNSVILAGRFILHGVGGSFILLFPCAGLSLLMNPVARRFGRRTREVLLMAARRIQFILLLYSLHRSGMTPEVITKLRPNMHGYHSLCLPILYF